MIKKRFYLSSNNPTQYLIQEDGKVFDENKNIELPQYDRKNQKIVKLCGKEFFIAKLVLEYFVPNPLGYTTYDFIDGNSLNHKVSNLMWGKNLQLKEDYQPIFIDSEESYFIITKSGKVYNRNTAHEVKNIYERLGNMTVVFTHKTKSYSRVLWKLYKECFEISDKELSKIYPHTIDIPKSIIKDLKEANIQIDGKDTIYKIYSDGRLMNTETGNELKGSRNENDYIRYKLLLDEKYYTFSKHRLLAEYFIENPNNYQFVDHIDSDIYNNSLTNLRWVNKRMNNQVRLNTQRVSKSIEFNNLEDEIWKQYFNFNYEISNKGRVKNTKTRQILKGSQDKRGYYRYNLTLNGQLKGFLGHRLVFETFNGYVPDIINHIDGNKSNNELNNLEEVSNSENIAKAIYETKSFKKWGKIQQTDKDGNVIAIYTTSKEASEKTGIPSGTIRSAITKKSLTRGYYWTKIYE